VSAQQIPPVVKLVTRSFMQDPYPDLDRLRRDRAATPVDSSGMRMWIVTRLPDARRLLADPAIKKDLTANQAAILRSSVLRPDRLRGVPVTLRRHMLDRDEPDHTRLRRLVSGHFTGAAVESLRPEIERNARELADQLPSGRPVDLLGDFARPLARMTTARLLGLPRRDTGDFPRWVNALLTAPDTKELQRAATALIAYIRAVVDQKEHEPGDDILTDLIEGRRRGDLGENELIASVQLLLTGGMEPSNAIANTVYALLTNPGQLSRLRAEPELRSRCVEESLRYESPFRMLTPRYSVTPVDLGDTVVPGNEIILVSAAAANRDPAIFADPGTFDISRLPQPNLSFGRGIHRCLGAQLGRLETEIGVSALLLRRPGLRLAEPAAAAESAIWQPGIFMRRLRSLPVVLT
jgi:cytochrome P450 PksS